MKKSRVRPFATIRAGHAPIKCVWLSSRDADTEGADGFYSGYKGILAVHGALTPALAAETIVHELLHVACEMAGIEDGAIPKTEEQLVTMLTKPMSAILAQNGEMCHWLVDSFHSNESNIRVAWTKRKARK